LINTCLYADHLQDRWQLNVAGVTIHELKVSYSKCE
jgi:hypothetical protein